MTLKSNLIHVYVISLSDETLRRKSVKNKLNGIFDKFEFFEAIDGKKGIARIEKASYSKVKHDTGVL